MLCGCRDVRISPTMEEVLCKDPPWLPKNAANAYHPLEGVERLLDVHFRLLRHDSLQSFFDNAQLLLAPAAAAEGRAGAPELAVCSSAASGSARSTFAGSHGSGCMPTCCPQTLQTCWVLQ